jgi:hypothetical protein
MAFDLKDYVTVSQRVAEFYKIHPDGRIVSDAPQVVELANQVFISITTRVYRSPDDTLPCAGTAWEPFPGKTQFTRESEMMNAETSAIGRALAAAGIMVSRSLASANEVQARQPDPKAKKTTSTPSKAPESPSDGLVPESVVVDITSRLSALRDDIRRQAKDAFLEAFGKPSDLSQIQMVEALDFVTEWEMA